MSDTLLPGSTTWVLDYDGEVRRGRAEMRHDGERVFLRVTCPDQPDAEVELQADASFDAAWDIVDDPGAADVDVLLSPRARIIGIRHITEPEIVFMFPTR